MELIIWITLKFNEYNWTRNAILVINFSRIFKKTFCTKYNKLQQSTNYFTAKYKYRRCSFKNLKFLYLEECQFSSMYFPFKLLSLVFFFPNHERDTRRRSVSFELLSGQMKRGQTGINEISIVGWQPRAPYPITLNN